jgi:hypothetical protein
MATIPLNSFKTTTYNLTNDYEIIYAAPAGVTTVVLMAQVANIDPANTIYASATLVRNSNTTSIIKNAAVPINDAVSLLSGKLIIQSGDSFYAKSNANGNSQLILSYLETANQ